MTPAAQVSLPIPLPCQMPPRHGERAQGPKEAGLRLRRAVFWAVQHYAPWRAALQGLRFRLVTPSFGPARLEQHLPDGGYVTVSIEAGTLRLLRLDSTAATDLALPLPDRVLTLPPG